jgi:pimeloyl-ACP methyl ester carboxylesterase
VLALHGWQGHAAQFSELALALAAGGFQVIAVDAPAHGRSPGNRAHATAFADALLEIVPELGDVHAVLGHSMGGGAALYAMARGLSADRAVIFASPARFGDVLARLAADLGLPAGATRQFIGWMERLTGVPVAELDIAALAREAPPMLLVHDRDDRIIPFADAEHIVARTGASLLATRRLGHRRVLSDPAVVARVLDFLSAAAPARC